MITRYALRRWAILFVFCFGWNWGFVLAGDTPDLWCWIVGTLLGVAMVAVIFIPLALLDYKKNGIDKL